MILLPSPMLVSMPCQSLVSIKAWMPAQIMRKYKEFFVCSHQQHYWQGRKIFEMKRICHPQGLMKREREKNPVQKIDMQTFSSEGFFLFLRWNYILFKIRLRSEDKFRVMKNNQEGCKNVNMFYALDHSEMCSKERQPASCLLAY